ncbi:hypothetical protein COBT_001189 [Conglomerata obtusa]
MKIQPHFGKCLIKRRFKPQAKVITSSITSSTAIESLLENREMRGKSSKDGEVTVDSKLEAHAMLYNTDNRIPPRVSHKGMSKGDYKLLEKKVFNTWKMKNGNFIFERNLEIWRQYWIAIERCDVIVQVIDCRCIDLFLVEDVFEAYKNKVHLLLFNKCDLLNISSGEINLHKKSINSCKGNIQNRSINQKIQVESDGVNNEENKVRYNINNNEEYIYERLNNLQQYDIKAYFINNQTSISEIINNYKNKVFAFTGFPNVGKSSTINNLFKTKKVTVSKTPGKTKHIQSLFVGTNQVIDTPGIVFPTEDRIILLLYGVINIETCDSKLLIEFIINYIGINSLIKHYKLKNFINDSRNSLANNFMNAFCVELSFDYGKAVKQIVIDFMDGKIELINESEIEANYEWFGQNKKSFEIRKSGNTYFVGNQ